MCHFTCHVSRVTCPSAQYKLHCRVVPRPSSRPTHHCSTTALQATFLLQTRAVTGTRVGGGGGGIILHLRTAQWHTERNLEAPNIQSFHIYSILPICARN